MYNKIGTYRTKLKQPRKEAKSFLKTVGGDVSSFPLANSPREGGADVYDDYRNMCVVSTRC